MGKFAWEVEALMSVDEYEEWAAFYKYEYEEEKKANEQAAAKAKSGKRR